MRASDAIDAARFIDDFLEVALFLTDNDEGLIDRFAGGAIRFSTRRMLLLQVVSRYIVIAR